MGVRIMTKRTLKEVGKNPQPSDTIRLKEGECIIDLRVTHVGDGIVKLSRTTHDCIVDKAMFKALCEEREAQLLTENI